MSFVSPGHAFFAAVGLACLSMACLYSVLAVVAMVRRRLEPRHLPRTAGPAVTLLKPLCGAEPGLYVNLRTFCVQDYSQYQVVFGVRDSADPALAVVERLVAEFPDLRIDVAVNAQQHGSNRKVSNLLNMLEYAQHDVLVIADSDARVGPDYLATVTAPLQDADTGLVTCLYHSVPAGNLWSRIGAMYVNEWYMPSVLLGRMLGNREFASGQTLCLTRQTLDAIGGLRPIANHLADDYQLGASVRELGKQIVLSTYVTTAEQYDPSLEELIRHETRWMRTIRVLRPASFPFLLVSFTLPLALAGLALSAAAAPALEVGIGLFLVCVYARILIHRLCKLTYGPAGRSSLWLLPARELLLFWVWLRAFITSRVSWRGTEFEVDVHGVMRGGQL